MKYVVDCSTAVKWFVAEIDRPKALRLRDDYLNGTCELLAPDLFPTELANALLFAEQRAHSRIAPGQAAVFLAQALQSLPTIHDAVPLQCAFVTADGKLVAALQAAFPFVVALASMP